MEKWQKTNCSMTRRQHVQDNGARSGSKRATSEPNRRSKTSGRWFVVLLNIQIQRQKCKYKYKYNATKTKKQHQWQVICASFKHLDSFVWKQLRSNVLPLPCYSNQLSWLSKLIRDSNQHQQNHQVGEGNLNGEKPSLLGKRSVLESWSTSPNGVPPKKPKVRSLANLCEL